MIVKKTSVFPASPETVYEKIRKIETLRQVSAPYVSFEPWGGGERRMGRREHVFLEAQTDGRHSLGHP